MNDQALFALIFSGEGAVRLGWQVATRCDCFADDSRQPQWGHEACGGLGAIYAPAVEIRALFRSQSRWTGTRESGEHALGEAQLTTPIGAKPGYTDRRIRDRYTVLDAAGDVAPGRVFYVAASAVPFLFDGTQRAWRVKVQSLEQANRAIAQP